MSDEAFSRWSETYSYDSRDRLTKACMNAHCSRYYAYAYDGVGNRTSLETRKTETLYTYDAADELVSSSEQKHGHHQEVTLYAYDLNGNAAGPCVRASANRLFRDRVDRTDGRRLLFRLATL